MAKRKFGASVIILCIAAVTLISGTYAWFLVGGFASLFDLGFNVIETSGSLELQGDAGTAHNKESGASPDSATVSSTNWGNYLARSDFKPASFIVKDDGAFKPVSSRDAEKFLMVGLKDDVFLSNGEAPKKENYTADDKVICYNNFTFKVRSTGEEIVGNVDDEYGAFMQIRLNGDMEKDEKIGENDGAAIAARVAVTFDGVTTIYSIDGEAYDAVTSEFGTEIIDENNNRIIDSNDTNYGSAGLAAPSSPVLYKALRETKDGELQAVKIFLGNVPNKDSAGKEVTVKVWLEGNDKDCVDFEDRSIAGSQLVSRISFGITE